MIFDDYQHEALKYLVNPKLLNLPYGALGLNEESGEVAGKIKKAIRDKGGLYSSQDIDSIVAELGDVLWYLSLLATCLGVPLEKVAEYNLSKLKSRMEHGTISGSGDNR